MPVDLPFLRRLSLAAACAYAGTTAVVPAVAGAQSGGGATAQPGGAAPAATAPPASSPEDTAAGGPKLAGKVKPVLITCRTACLGLDVAQAGSVVRVTGESLTAARTVTFLGAKGTADDVTAPVTVVAGDAVDATVPPTAASGPIALVDARGTTSRATGKTITIAGSDRAAKATATPAARVDVRKVFFRGPHRATLSVFVPPGAPRRVTVELLRGSDRAAVGRWELDVQPGTVQSVSWSGVVGGKVQRDGRYRFEVSAPAPGAAAAQDDALASAFTFLGDTFPVRGKHDYGQGAAVFGAGRGGRSHQGQDVFAACGTPLVAARGGKVKFRDFHSAAGNYVVIDAAGTGTDYVYMHLKDPAFVEKGDKVATGQPIGEVGDTGRADGCHLHFELWKTPGWYTGGAPIDPLPSLKRWDARS